MFFCTSEGCRDHLEPQGGAREMFKKYGLLGVVRMGKHGSYSNRRPEAPLSVFKQSRGFFGSSVA